VAMSGTLSLQTHLNRNLPSVGQAAALIASRLTLVRVAKTPHAENSAKRNITDGNKLSFSQVARATAENRRQPFVSPATGRLINHTKN
jgi:hypothetical protein